LTRDGRENIGKKEEQGDAVMASSPELSGKTFAIAAGMVGGGLPERGYDFLCAAQNAVLVLTVTQQLAFVGMPRQHTIAGISLGCSRIWLNQLEDGCTRVHHRV